MGLRPRYTPCPDCIRLTISWNERITYDTLTVSLYLPHMGIMTNCTSEKSDSMRPVYHPHWLLGMPVSWTNSLTYLRAPEIWIQ